MKIYEHLYIDGRWIASQSGRMLDVVNPATEKQCASVPLSNKADCVAAIEAARRAFASWSLTPAKERAAFIVAAADELALRSDELADVITSTMGCPRHICPGLQVNGAIKALRKYSYLAQEMDRVEVQQGFQTLKEPVGVCSLITPWNYPLSILIGKVAPALAAGCTMIAKPAEQTPLQDFIVAEVFDKIGLPDGVFNLVTGIGPELGPTLCGHPDVDMVSFTGSTRAGIQITESAASTIKRVCLELGGKSPLIITKDADLDRAVRYGVQNVMMNTGQTCSALTRMLVPASKYEAAIKIAQAAAEENKPGDPLDSTTTMGPLSSILQKSRVLEYIELGQKEGAKLVTGGTEMPNGLTVGAYVAPTIFAEVDNQMRIAQEEIFGPVVCMIPFEDDADAVRLANDTVYGLSSAVFAGDEKAGMAIARKIKAGQCYVQGASFTTDAPFGGYKQSGNGREWGREGLHEFIETKAVMC